jgi:hypothetical protein
LSVPSTVVCLKANTKETTADLRLTSYYAYIVCLETHYMKSRAQIPTQDVEGFFELLIPHEKGLTLDFLYYRYSAFGPVWTETRTQSGDWYNSVTLHPG